VVEVWVWSGVVVALGLVVAFGVWFWRHQVKRARLYRALAEERQQVVRQHAPLIPALPECNGLSESFRQHFITYRENFLTAEALEKLRAECLANQGRSERSYMPVHKKGGTLSYEALHRHAPACLSFFHSEALRRLVSDVVGAEVRPCADHDQSACSILYYDQAGDHINWHFDHNFYKGRHFTVLLSLVNRSAQGGPSSSELQTKDAAGNVSVVDTCENSIVVFEGARVLHRASPAAEGDLRVILSMTFTTDPRVPWLSEAMRRCKDTAYYGIRALWD
jgi:hypothetical protein